MQIKALVPFVKPALEKAVEKLAPKVAGFSSQGGMGSLGGLSSRSPGDSTDRGLGTAALRFGSKLPGGLGGASQQLLAKYNDFKNSGTTSAGQMQNAMGQGVQPPDNSSGIQSASATDSMDSQEKQQEVEMQKQALISQRMTLFSALMTQQNKGVENEAKAATGQ